MFMPQVASSFSLHSPHNTSAAKDASHRTLTPSPMFHQHVPHIHAQARVLLIKPRELCLVMVFQLEFGRLRQLKFRDKLMVHKENTHFLTCSQVLKRDKSSFKPSLIAFTNSKSSLHSAKYPVEEPRQSIVGSNMFIGVDETYTSLFPPKKEYKALELWF